MQVTLQNVWRDLGLVFTYLAAAPWVFWVWIALAFMLGMLVMALRYRHLERALETWKKAQQKAFRDQQAARRASARAEATSIQWRG